MGTPLSCQPPSAAPMAQNQKVAVVGASLGGLASANVLFQLGFTVHVYERGDSTFENRGHGLGFVDVGLWQKLRGARMLRRGTQASRAQGAFYYGDLWRFLYEGLPDGTVRFGHMVEDLGDVMRPTIGDEAYDIVVVADGGWSVLRRYVTTSQPQYAGYVVYRCQIDADDVPGFADFGVFKNGIFDTIALPLTTDSGRNSIVCGAFIATPEAEVRTPEAGTSRHGAAEAKEHRGNSVPDWFLPLYREKFGAHARGELVRLMEAILAKGKVSPHPQFEYAADAVTAGRVVVVGDAAHMASPRTAVGAHTAVLDAIALREAFAATAGIDDALKLYSRDGVLRAQELFRRSREVSQDFVPAEGMTAIVSPATLVKAR
mmetsp:Transcript_70336/g.198454  ORF Transcript_70336/g.198454 Transcript_70336/m.198454 type:complete len:374 (+) Transcript_70336:49-1170(+)